MFSSKINVALNKLIRKGRPIGSIINRKRLKELRHIREYTKDCKIVGVVSDGSTEGIIVSNPHISPKRPS